MSKLLIQNYLADPSKLRQVGGTHREGVVSEAFKDLLKGWARSHDLTFVPQYEIESRRALFACHHPTGTSHLRRRIQPPSRRCNAFRPESSRC